jgi:predicted tellurium resistance membrane protein TerC
MKTGGWLKAIIAGALLWVAMSLVAIAHQPAHAGSAVATIYTVLSIVVAILGCLILRW